MKILLIEDDTLMQETLNDFLQRHGYQVTSVGSVAEAEDATFQTYYDLYLIDINLPDGTGMELLESLRFADDKTPTMFLTALTDIQTIVTCFDLGALDYIKKPFHPEELLARIKAKLETNAIHYGHISLSLDHRIVQCNGEMIDLPTQRPTAYFRKTFVTMRYDRDQRGAVRMPRSWVGYGATRGDQQTQTASRSSHQKHTRKGLSA